MRIGRFETSDEARTGVFEDGVVCDVTDEFDGFRNAISRPQDAVDVDCETYDVEDITHLPTTTARRCRTTTPA